MELLFISSKSCKLCNVYYLLVKNIANTLRINLQQLLIDCDADIAVKYKIRSVPSVVVLKDSGEVESLIGVYSKEKLENWIKSII